MTAQGLAVERDCGIGADTLKVQEGALARERGDLETLLVMRRAVQVAVQELAVAVVVVPIMGHGDRLALRLLAFEPGGPPLRKLLHLAALLTLGGYKVHLRTAHRAARRNGNTALLVVIDGAVEVIDHPVVLYDKALMGKHLVVGLRRVDQIVALPIVPGHQVVAAGKGVVGQVGTRGVEGREVEHHIHIAHFDDLGIARDRALCLVREDRVAGIALPLLHILRQGDADALALIARLGILAACVVVHHKGGTECLRAIPIDHALILHEALPPLHILILDGENRSFRGLPRVGLRGILLRPCQADVERCLHRLIATTCATDVGHPATVLELLQLIRPAPLHIDQSGESATLIHIPPLFGPLQDLSQGFPLQEVLALGQVGFVATAILCPLTVVEDIGHVPFVAFAEEGRAVDLGVVRLGGNHQAIFIGGSRLLIDLGHALLRNVSLGRNRKRKESCCEEQDQLFFHASRISC